MTKNIFSRDADFQRFQVLRSNRNKRHRYGQFFVEGVRNLNQAVENGWQLASLLFPGDRPLSGWAKALLNSVPTQVNYRLPGALMDELSGKEEGSELLAVVNMRPGGTAALPCRENPLLCCSTGPRTGATWARFCAPATGWGPMG